ncbi:hypothetical protein [Burkholderia stagnalis]|uniref:hypothetical protein n=1 Tax=Burkholderia stagnalis TaxID=1503054 RepID=UPI000AB47123|nr:hypothetical protein [Burkholderia stagnalis]
MQNSPSENPISTRKVAEYLTMLRKLLKAEMLRAEAVSRGQEPACGDWYENLIAEIDRAAQVLKEKNTTI